MISKKMAEAGISLPEPQSVAGSYVPVVIADGLAFVSGQIPAQDGQVKFKGKLGRDVTIEQGQQAARLCAVNGLSQLNKTLCSLEDIVRIVKLTGFVNCEPSFTDQPKVVNGASDLLVQIFGEKGKHARAAVGVSSLPLDSAVEVEFIVQLRRTADKG
jgi:enamine deaminase RidA (YjgF/YER057c/UK114 family)